jgi:hypothetical protein
MEIGGGQVIVTKKVSGLGASGFPDAANENSGEGNRVAKGRKENNLKFNKLLSGRRYLSQWKKRGRQLR